MSDGTQLNPGANGDLVSDEDMTGVPRQSSAVPQLSATNASYKIERTKVAVGPYGQDRGDADIDGRPFPVETAAERRIMEQELLRQADLTAWSNMRARASEHFPSLMFARTTRETGRF